VPRIALQANYTRRLLGGGQDTRACLPVLECVEADDTILLSCSALGFYYNTAAE
jgi:hypothetical protein